MSDTKKYPTLVWLDLEMTGLDPDSERIIEIASAVTSHDLSEVIEGPNLVIKQPAEFIDNMDEWNTCLLYTSPSPRDVSSSRMPSSA